MNDSSYNLSLMEWDVDTTDEYDAWFMDQVEA
jgi:hypothetical protein